MKMFRHENDPKSNDNKRLIDSNDENDGFYLLKKESQRRTTLSRVLTQDSDKIAEVWMSKISLNYFGQTIFLTKNILTSLINALKEYIANQNIDNIDITIQSLKEELDFDSSAINQLHFAVYLFQESVNEVLRSHSIKPHWMFALDNLVRNAVQAAITILSPGKFTIPNYLQATKKFLCRQFLWPNFIETARIMTVEKFLDFVLLNLVSKLCGYNLSNFKLFIKELAANIAGQEAHHFNKHMCTSTINSTNTTKTDSFQQSKTRDNGSYGLGFGFGLDNSR